MATVAAVERASRPRSTGGMQLLVALGDLSAQAPPSLWRARGLPRWSHRRRKPYRAPDQPWRDLPTRPRRCEVGISADAPRARCSKPRQHAPSPHGRAASTLR